ncbi:unnamed protein product, partial [Symbiodinium pilosum]
MWEDLARVCAAQAGLKSGSDGETSKCCSRDQLQSPRLWAKADQAESYEQLVKRRQQEVRHLQESVKMLQANDEVANTVGKLQYRLLLCQWEKGNVQRQLQTATQDLRQARRELLENDEQVEQERQEHDQTE